MSLATGTRIGPYEILAPLGAGGMGEVFRARDTRLGREVALKTLPPHFARERERLERFEREARAAGSLQHPGIVMLFDIGTHEERPYFVSELVDGHSLRTQLNMGPIKPSRAIEIAIEIGEALGAAHAAGILHRDIKPENIAFTKDGRAKLLDFGLAKLTQPDFSMSEDTSARTLDGAMMGTAAYMAPEQARGETADHRVDLFAMGCVLHEMLTGKSPFHRGAPVETIAAVLKDDAPPLPAEIRTAWPGLDLLVSRCLEKSPARRFESARDLATALRALRQAVEGAPRGADATSRETAPAAGGSNIHFRRLTYRRGAVQAARFTPDGHGVVYSSGWEGQPLELFWVFGGSNESRPLGVRDAALLAVSKTSEMAISRGVKSRGSFIHTGMLSRVSLGAGLPRDIQADIQYADWSPDGVRLLGVREVDGKMRIEYPLGTTLYESDGGWISEPRISPDGRRVAFLDHPIRGDDAGHVVIVEENGAVRRLVHMTGTLRGLAWSPGGREIWYTGSAAGVGRALRAVNAEGQDRLLLQIAGNMLLHDAAPDGRVLISHGDERLGMQSGVFETREERDLSWFDWSLLRDMTRDGSMIAFDESGEGGGGAVFLRGTDGSPASRIGDGLAFTFSPDEKWVLTSDFGQKGRLSLVPIGAGAPRTISLPDFDIHLAGWLSDPGELWMAANREGEGIRAYRVQLSDESVVPITPVGGASYECRPTPDGRYLLASALTGEPALFPIEGGDPVAMKGFSAADRPIGWSQDGETFYCFERGSVPARIFTVDMRTGERKFWREVGPSDPSGVSSVAPVRLSADGSRYAYSYVRALTDLFEVSGLK